MAASAGYFYKEKILICPYNWAHVILKSRMQTHLVKCMKSHPQVVKLICPYDATHRIDITEICEHLESCPAQVTVVSFKYTVGSESDGTTNHNQFLPVENRDIESSENWDDSTVATYDPGHRLQDPTLLVQLKGATPSERKAFRKQREQLSKAVNTEYNAASFTHKPTDDEFDGEEAAGGSKETSTGSTPVPPSLPPSVRLKNDQELLDRNPRRARDSNNFNCHNGAAEATATLQDYNQHFPTPGESIGRPTANTGAIPKSYKQAVQNSFQDIYDNRNTPSSTTDERNNNASVYSAAMDTSSSTTSSPDQSMFRKFKGPFFSQKKRDTAVNTDGHQKNKYMKNGYFREVKNYSDSGYSNSYSDDRNSAGTHGDPFNLGSLRNAIPDDYKAPMPPSVGKHLREKNKQKQTKNCDVMKGNNLMEAFDNISCNDTDETSEVSHDDGAANFAAYRDNQGCRNKTLFKNWGKKYDDSDSEEENSGINYAI